MEMWFSEFHTPDVKHSIRVNRQLYSRQSDYQRIDIFETPEFGRVLTLDGNVMLTERDEFIYDEMITHVPMAVHKEARDILVIGAGDGGVVRELTRYDRVRHIDLVEMDPMVVEACRAYLPGNACRLDDRRVHLHYENALKFIRRALLHMVTNMSIFKPDIMLMVPMMIETIYKRLSPADPQIPKAVLAEKVFGGKLQTIFTGGAHLDPYYIDRFAEYGVQILEGYGMSECSPVISNNTPENHKPGSIGRPLENVEIRFENGEILVKGTSVMKGYYQMPDETAETLKDGWLHTGDKGYMDEDGYLFINGRVKNLIILSNGENISPEEIENKLALNPLVGEVIVTGEDNGLTARIYPEQAVVEAKALDTEMIRSQLQEFLDEYNKNQPTYRRITGLVIRKNPFIRSTTKKIRRQDVLIDEPQA